MSNTGRRAEGLLAGKGEGPRLCNRRRSPRARRRESLLRCVSVLGGLFVSFFFNLWWRGVRCFCRDYAFECVACVTNNPGLAPRASLRPLVGSDGESSGNGEAI